MMRALVAAIAALTLIVPPAPVLAEANPYREFSAKRIKPPSSGTRKRITVQIEPGDQDGFLGGSSSGDVQQQAAAPAAQDQRAGGGETLSWFWSDISPSIGAKGPGRLEPALIRLGNPPQGSGVGSPRLQTMQEIAARYGRDILVHTVGTQVSPALVLAVIAVESGGRPQAVSHAGAQGLMQLMPAAAERFGVTDRMNPTQNIKGGVAYLDVLMKQFDNDPILALASYNAGENAVLRAGGVPNYAETRAYVPKVLQAFKTAKGLCLTPPQLATDGCVFRVASR